MFECEHCKYQIKQPAVGTEHRNHCSRCLYSKHLDEVQPGDRQAECGGLMEPVGLTFKQESDGPGELMIVHRCVECGKISKNRVAGDDQAESIIKVFEESLKRKDRDESWLDKDDEKELYTQLYGKPWVEEHFENMSK